MTIGDSLGPEGKRSDLEGVHGWLAFLCVSLIFLTPLGALVEIGTLLTSGTSTENLIGVGLDVVSSGFAIFVGVSLVQIRSYAVRAAKIFFFITLALDLLAMLSIFEPDATPQQVFYIVRTTFTTTAWILYLYRSERVRVTYGRTTATNISEVFR